MAKKLFELSSGQSPLAFGNIALPQTRMHGVIVPLTHIFHLLGITL